VVGSSLKIAPGNRAMAHKPLLFVFLLAIIGAGPTHVADAAPPTPAV
jgi:hypothetical protein